jgi:hypothetical protein
MLLTGRDPAHQQRCDERRSADGEAWKDDVERDGERELQAGEQFRVEGHGATRVAPTQRMSRARCSDFITQS